MLNKEGFNLWAKDYDQTVNVSEEKNEYPFAGYKKILNTIYNKVMQKKQANVLDIGFGTGILTSKLYEKGHHIDGVDFSERMVSIAKAKMPTANLVEWDFSNGLPPFVRENTYHYIISTYTLHHLTDEDKIKLIKSMLPLLTDDGKMIIGDVAFQTREELNVCKQNSGDNWDDDEHYFVFEELNKSLQDVCHCEFTPLSHCGGVLIISN